jgi:type I restriction enzyme M protein
MGKKKLTLTCPIRGELNTQKKNKDGLTSTEEYYRIEAIKYLMKKGYWKNRRKD